MSKLQFNVSQLAKLTGRDETELTNELFEKGEDGTLTAKENAIELVQGYLSQEFQRVSNAAEKKGKRGRMTEFEGNIKDKYSYVGNTQGEALFDKILELEVGKAVENAKKALLEEYKDKQLKTPEEIEAYVKGTEFFKGVVNNYNNQIEEKDNALKAQGLKFIEDKKRNIFDKRVDAILNDLKPIVPDSKKAKWFSQFKDSIYSGSNHKLGEDDNILMLDKAGNPLQDSVFKDIDLSRYVKEKANDWFEFHSVDPNKGAPKGKPKTTSGFDYANSSENEISIHLQKVAIDNPELFEAEKERARKARN